MQSDKQPPNKLAMSRALGAAFLSHQVEQLEKTVGRESRSNASNNWRERSGQMASGRGGKRGGAPQSQTHQSGRKKERKDGRETGKPQEQNERTGSNEPEKKADTIVVDASVLVHALAQLKKWCKDGTQVILIPLEALNTLDLLKKGSSPLAHRARAASRILESQVGTNPRIRVQRDDAFVLWDEIPFRGPSSEESATDTKIGLGNVCPGLSPPPEWLRRTICCGRWEMMNAASGPPSDPAALALLENPFSHLSTPTPSLELASHPPPHKESDVEKSRDNSGLYQAKVVLAIVTSSTMTSIATGSSLDTNTIHPGRYERADGSLVRIWAQRAGIEVLDVDPTVAPSTPHTPYTTLSTPERRRSHTHGQERRVPRESKDSGAEREAEHKSSLVEKPIAMAIVNEQPVKGLRVLARGEKLDP